MMNLLRTLSLMTIVSTVAVAVMGSYVVQSGSGLGCPDWPLCHGRIVPPFEVPVLIEWTHRLLAFSVVVLLFSIVCLSWWQRRPERRVAALGAMLLAIQATLGGVTVLLDLPPLVVATHQGFAMLFFGAVVWFAVLVFRAGEHAQGEGVTGNAATL